MQQLPLPYPTHCFSILPYKTSHSKLRQDSLPSPLFAAPASEDLLPQSTCFFFLFCQAAVHPPHRHATRALQAMFPFFFSSPYVSGPKYPPKPFFHQGWPSVTLSTSQDRRPTDSQASTPMQRRGTLPPPFKFHASVPQQT